MSTDGWHALCMYFVRTTGERTMSVPVGSPHLAQLGDPQDELPAFDDYGFEPDYDAPELYDEEEGARALD
jgi:hypothetical protein